MATEAEEEAKADPVAMTGDGAITSPCSEAFTISFDSTIARSSKKAPATKEAFMEPISPGVIMWVSLMSRRLKFI